MADYVPKAQPKEIDDATRALWRAAEERFQQRDAAETYLIGTGKYTPAEVAKMDLTTVKSELADEAQRQMAGSEGRVDPATMRSWVQAEIEFSDATAAREHLKGTGLFGQAEVDAMPTDELRRAVDNFAKNQLLGNDSAVDNATVRSWLEAEQRFRDSHPDAGGESGAGSQNGVTGAGDSAAGSGAGETDGGDGFIDPDAGQPDGSAAPPNDDAEPNGTGTPPGGSAQPDDTGAGTGGSGGGGGPPEGSQAYEEEVINVGVTPDGEFVEQPSTTETVYRDEEGNWYYSDGSQMEPEVAAAYEEMADDGTITPADEKPTEEVPAEEKGTEQADDEASQPDSGESGSDAGQGVETTPVDDYVPLPPEVEQALRNDIERLRGQRTTRNDGVTDPPEGEEPVEIDASATPIDSHQELLEFLGQPIEAGVGLGGSQAGGLETGPDFGNSQGDGVTDPSDDFDGPPQTNGPSERDTSYNGKIPSFDDYEEPSAADAGEDQGLFAFDLLSVLDPHDIHDIQGMTALVDYDPN